jgi:hypothetical protein
MGKRAAVVLTPGVWRIPTVGSALVNTFVLRDDDGQVTLIDAGVLIHTDDAAYVRRGRGPDFDRSMFDYDLVAFTHGPEIREGAREAVRGFLSHPRRFRGGL